VNSRNPKSRNDRGHLIEVVHVAIDKHFANSHSRELKVGVVKTHEERNYDLIIAIGPWKIMNCLCDTSGVRMFRYWRKGYEKPFDSRDTKS
jgi:hypothetical protein